jgi:hypothetical protein
MSENVGASTSHNPKGLHSLYRENITFYISCDLPGVFKIVRANICISHAFSVRKADIRAG